VIYVCPEGKIAVIERGKTSFEYALFGGHVENEIPEQAFLREIREELNITEIKKIKFNGIYGERGRDPRSKHTL